MKSLIILALLFAALSAPAQIPATNAPASRTLIARHQELFHILASNTPPAQLKERFQLPPGLTAAQVRAHLRTDIAGRTNRAQFYNFETRFTPPERELARKELLKRHPR